MGCEHHTPQLSSGLGPHPGRASQFDDHALNGAYSRTYSASISP
jgi:hypothetical protein